MTQIFRVTVQSIPQAAKINALIRCFAKSAPVYLCHCVDSRAARSACAFALWSVLHRQMTQLNRAADLRELALPPGNRLERLTGSRRGQYSIRINQQYRICFRWETGYADEVEVTDYH